MSAGNEIRHYKTKNPRSVMLEIIATGGVPKMYINNEVTLEKNGTKISINLATGDVYVMGEHDKEIEDILKRYARRR